MAKEVTKIIKLQISAGAANPSPPVGPALGQAGVNIMAFCKEFNAATQSQSGDVLPVVISVYKDKSFTFVTKRPPAGNLLKKAAGLASGSKEANKTKVGKITKAQLMDVVKIKMPDLNTKDPEAAARILAGTARQMGLEIEGMSAISAAVSRKGATAPAGGSRQCGIRSNCQPQEQWPNNAANDTNRQPPSYRPASPTRSPMRSAR